LVRRDPMAVKKKPRKAPDAASAPSQSAPLNFTEEHVRMAREGRSKEVFKLLLAEKASKKDAD
jgi:hypothetical protein